MAPPLEGAGIRTRAGAMSMPDGSIIVVAYHLVSGRRIGRRASWHLACSPQRGEAGCIMLERLREFIASYHPKYICVLCLSKATELDRASLDNELARLHAQGQMDRAETECFACFVMGPAFRASAAV